MSSVLAGTSRTAIAFVIANLRALVTVSALPFVLIVALNLGHMAVYGVEVAGVDSGAGTGEAASGAAANLIVNILSALLWLWFAVKVLRLYLLREEPSLIGSGGTLRASGAMILYHAGLFAILLAMGVAVLAVAAILLGGLQSRMLYAISVIAGGLAMIFVLARLFVGFVPVAIGERPPFFSGWSISEPERFALFVRIGAYGGALMLALIGLGLVWTELFGDPLAVSETDATRDGAAAVPRPLAFALAVQVLSVVANWFLVVFFAEAYLRLTGRIAPLEAR